MSAPQRARKRRAAPRNAQAAQQPAHDAAKDDSESSDRKRMPQSTLPSITLGQLKRLAGAGAKLDATIRATEGGYRIEVELGPRCWQLVSTHSKRPRLFRGLEGAAHTARDLGPQKIQLQLRCA